MPQSASDDAAIEIAITALVRRIQETCFLPASLHGTAGRTC